MIGGHGTSIAWAPIFAEEYGISGAVEIGIACATFGLVLASLMGGPIAKFLINRHDLKSEEEETLDVGVCVAVRSPSGGAPFIARCVPTRPETMTLANAES